MLNNLHSMTQSVCTMTQSVCMRHHLPRRIVLTMLFATVVSLGNAWGAWEKASSITAGDVIVLVYESGSTHKEMTGISTTSTTYGIANDFTSTPAGTYSLTVEAGSSSGSFSFKNGNNYISWSSGNSLTTSTNKNGASSWTISISNGNATITNVGTTKRVLKYNTSSPRFACYTSGQQAIQIYKQSGGGSTGDDTCDDLTQTTTGVTGTSYTEWSGKSGDNSDAVYAGQSACGNSSIQLRSNNNNSGIITTTSGGKAKSVSVIWNSNTASGRTLNIYGKNSAYSAATDLYNSSNQGTLLGTIAYGTNTSLNITEDYEYIGLRSASGAMYLEKVTICWETEEDCQNLGQINGSV